MLLSVSPCDNLPSPPSCAQPSPTDPPLLPSFLLLQVPLYERGYEKDPAKVAFEGAKAAQRAGIDVLLVDTAGRMQVGLVVCLPLGGRGAAELWWRALLLPACFAAPVPRPAPRSSLPALPPGPMLQDNEPLMRALSNLINLNQPDLVLFVGEALVGNDAGAARVPAGAGVGRNARCVARVCMMPLPAPSPQHSHRPAHAPPPLPPRLTHTVDQLTKFNQRLADLCPDPRQVRRAGAPAGLAAPPHPLTSLRSTHRTC